MYLASDPTDGEREQSNDLRLMVVIVEVFPFFMGALDAPLVVQCVQLCLNLTHLKLFCKYKTFNQRLLFRCYMKSLARIVPEKYDRLWRV